MENQLRIGIVGLGGRWHKRYKPALFALRRRFKVSVLCDQVQERAVLQAKQLACAVAAGPTQLLERDDVDAVMILDGQWFRLWPLERACHVGKPVLCSISLEMDDPHADALHRHVEERRLPIMMEMAPRYAPATARLRTLFEGELGRPRLLQCEITHPVKQPTHLRLRQTCDPNALAEWMGGAGIPLLDWCAGLLDGEPLNVTTRSVPGAGFSSLFLEFPGGRGIQITRRRGFGHRPAVRLEVSAENGMASVQLPGQVSWTTSERSLTQTLRRRCPWVRLLLEHFHDVLQGKAAPSPTFDDAYRLLRWLRIAVKSRDEGRLLLFPT
ncbi:MAG TPA: Gfo/Idh/MocA family oxidoreductase [Gemmataceae bacterium]|nr:Gfo/Idh/MocA family oxidoreductase [Gemmataceae bacterium]